MGIFELSIGARPEGMEMKTAKFELGSFAKIGIAIAAAYTFLWGVWILLGAQSYFHFSGLEAVDLMNEEKVWGIFGMLGGLFYAAILFMPTRIRGVAVLSAILCGLGFSLSLYLFLAHSLTWKAMLLQGFGDGFGFVGFTNAAIALYFYRRDEKVGKNYFEGGEIGEVLAEYHDQFGSNISELNERQPVLMVFLRHFGCTFCREALNDVGTNRTEIEAAGVKIVLVHMVPEIHARQHMMQYPTLVEVSRVSDPTKRLYEAFELQQGTFNQLYGLKTWIEGFRAGVLEGRGIGKESGDVKQMPGIFLINQGKILRGFRHQSPADRPDYCSTVACD